MPPGTWSTCGGRWGGSAAPSLVPGCRHRVLPQGPRGGLGQTLRASLRRVRPRRCGRWASEVCIAWPVGRPGSSSILACCARSQGRCGPLPGPEHAGRGVAALRPVGASRERLLLGARLPLPEPPYCVLFSHFLSLFIFILFFLQPQAAEALDPAVPAAALNFLVSYFLALPWDCFIFIFSFLKPGRAALRLGPEGIPAGAGGRPPKRGTCRSAPRSPGPGGRWAPCRPGSR